MGRPRKPPERITPTLGEAIEDVRDQVRTLHRALEALAMRVEALRIIHRAETS
jgi:hypothetical protein